MDEIIEHPAAIMAALGIADLHTGTFQIISKPPGAPALYWHQDWARWDDPISLSPWPQQVFLNWYLTDTGPENGCLRVIPGSHRRRLDLHRHLVAPHEGGGYEIAETNECVDERENSTVFARETSCNNAGGSGFRRVELSESELGPRLPAE